MSSGGCSAVIEVDAAAGGSICLHLGQPREHGFLAVESPAVTSDRNVVRGRRSRRPNASDDLVARQGKNPFSHCPRLPAASYHGRHVAPTRARVNGLTQLEATTIARVRLDLATRPLAPGTLVICDEISQVSTRDAATPTARTVADRIRARLAAGGHRRRSAVGTGVGHRTRALLCPRRPGAAAHQAGSRRPVQWLHRHGGGGGRLRHEGGLRRRRSGEPGQGLVG